MEIVLYILQIFQKIGLVAIISCTMAVVLLLWRKNLSKKRLFLLATFVIISFVAFLLPNYVYTSLETANDIARNPNDMPSPINRGESERVKIDLELKEVVSEMKPGVRFTYWTYNGTVPGPMLRVREGDTVELTLKNPSSSMMPHNIDLHAVNGPGGGASVTNVLPGETKTLTFKALNPGLYVYHCAFPNVSMHIAHGMYGLILVEPQEGLPLVDKEFYVMQGEFYGSGILANKLFDYKKMYAAQPSFVVFNGRTGALTNHMAANVGDKIRIYFGNGGVNLISSFHVIGEVFDTVYPEASIHGAILKNVQTTTVPAGGATIVEFAADVPGEYILVDHALTRTDLGAKGVLKITGEDNKTIYDGEKDMRSYGSH